MNATLDRSCGKCLETFAVRVAPITGWWNCPACDIGWAPPLGDERIPPKRDITEQERNQCKSLYRAQLAGMKEHATRLAVHSGLPSEFIDGFRGSRYGTSAAVAAVERCALEAWPVLILSGSVDTGKTIAAAKAIWDRCRIAATKKRDGAPGWFVPARDLASAPWFGAEAFAVRARALGCDLLVIDDLGTEHSDTLGHWIGELEGILDARRNSGSETIITTNLSREQLAERYGDRAWKRMDYGEHFSQVQWQGKR